MPATRLIALNSSVTWLSGPAALPSSFASVSIGRTFSVAPKRLASVRRSALHVRAWARSGPGVTRPGVQRGSARSVAVPRRPGFRRRHRSRCPSTVASSVRCSGARADQDRDIAAGLAPIACAVGSVRTSSPAPETLRRHAGTARRDSPSQRVICSVAPDQCQRPAALRSDRDDRLLEQIGAAAFTPGMRSTSSATLSSKPSGPRERRVRASRCQRHRA